MPRKKLTSDPTPQPETTPAAPEMKRPRGRPRKVAPETAPIVVEAPVLAEKPKRGRPPKKVEAVVAAPAIPAPAGPAKRGPKPKAATVIPPVVEATPTPAQATPRRRGRPAKNPTPVNPTPVVVAAVEAPKPAAKRGRPPKAVAAPVTQEAPVITEAPVEAAPVATADAFDLGDGRELSVSFRPRASAQVKAQAPLRETPKAAAVSAPTPVATTVIVDGVEEPLPTFSFRARAEGAAKPEKKVFAPEPTFRKPQAQPKSEPAVPLDISEEEMPVISWRPRGAGTPEADTETDHSPEGEDDAGRRRRRGRGRGRDDERAPESVQTVSKPEPAKPIVKPPIAIPPHAPQVVLRNGVPVLVRDGRAFPAIAFGGDPTDARRETLTFEQIRMAAVDGVHLHVLHLPVEVDASTSEAVAERASSLIARVAEADPEAQTILFFEFLPSRDVERRFPDALYARTDGRPAEPSVCDDAYWGEAAALLRGVIQKLKGNDRLMGIQLDRGWLHPHEEGYDTSKAAENKFRAWARTRYGNDIVALRAAWFDGNVRFDTLTGPDAHEAAQTSDRFIRAGRRQRRAVDYHLFLSDATASRIGELAREVKEASEGCLLVGVDYGQTLEGSHPAGGHLALGKVMRTPEIDFVAGPPSYAGRESGGSAAFPAPVDSFPLNGKLYLSVEDYRTSLGGGAYMQDEPGNPVLRTPQALESIQWRGVGAALAHGMGVAWTDAGGDGSLRSNSVWDRANRVREVLTLRMGTPMGDPEVAVFIDERALAYLVDGDAFELLVQDVRESILRAGVSAAFYLLSDLAHREKFPDSKLYVFLNAWDIRPDARAAIKTRLQRDGKVLFWIYAAGLFDAGRDSLERAREVTGIALKPQPYASKAGTTLLNRRHPLTEAFPERTVSGNAALEPTYFAIPEDATVLGEYTQTGLPSFVVRDFGGGGPAEGRWTSVFLGEPKVTPALVRALAQMAGAHVWDFQDDVVHVRPPFLTIHCRGTGARAVALPAKEAAYDLINRNWVTVEGANLKFIGVDGATHSFLVGPRAEIEHLLSTDPESVLKVESLPPRELNVRQDASDFDVPIMKLGEFMVNGAEGDEVADEWFLRPGPTAEEGTSSEPAQAEESPDQVGKRRRRRGGRNGNGRDRDDRGGSAEPQSFAPAGKEDLGISVVFRKRQ